MRMVVDSSVLQEDMLRDQLSESRKNIAVVTDYLMIEALTVNRADQAATHRLSGPSKRLRWPPQSRPHCLNVSADLPLAARANLVAPGRSGGV